jgi:hypothetical protein
MHFAAAAQVLLRFELKLAAGGFEPVAQVSKSERELQSDG